MYMNPKKQRRKCRNCGKECSRPQYFYCNTKCQMEYEQKNYIKKWLNREVDGNKKNEMISDYVRNYLIERSNNQCELCGWHEINPFTRKVPLTVHHKDGNPENSYVENLIYICPNCHALTESYGNKNKGKGRNKLRKVIRQRYNG